MNKRLATVGSMLCLAVTFLVGLGIPVESPAPGQDKKAPKRVSVDLGGGVSLKLVGIPAGKFTMGTPQSEIDFIRKKFGAKTADTVAATSKPHEVEITKPFYMGVYEVTQAEFEKVMSKNPSAFAPKGLASNKVEGKDTT